MQYIVFAKLFDNRNILITCTDGTPWLITAPDYRDAFTQMLEEAPSILRELKSRLQVQFLGIQPVTESKGTNG